MIQIFTSTSADCPTCQISRIEKGFIELGHKITRNPAEADLIYVNNAFYDEALNLKRQDSLKNGCRLILNVLDIPTHLLPGFFDLNKLTVQLLQADAITSISEFVRDQIWAYCGVKSEIIYQPIMNIYKLDQKLVQTHKIIQVGRRSDPNKRVHIGIEALQILGYQEHEVGMIGPEPTVWGDYLGLLTENQLNQKYNSVDYSLSLGKIEGLNLPVAEAMSAGCIPLIFNDLTTREELLPRDLFPEYDDLFPNSLSLVHFISHLESNLEKKEKLKNRLYQHYKQALEEKFKPISVAEKIINIYKTLN